MELTKNQILKLFQGWVVDTEQPDGIIRLDKGVSHTSDTVAYVYFERHAGDRYHFVCFDIQ